MTYYQHWFKTEPIFKNNIEVVGDFLETAMILRVNKDGKENTLVKLEILCK